MYPTNIGGRTITSRSGLLIATERGDWAEAAPLPGFSSESIDDVATALFDQDWEAFPCLRFAKDSLVATPWTGEPLQGLLVDELEPEVVEMLSQTTLPVKVKVGRATPSADAARVRSVLDALATPVVRCDANQQWTLDEATEFVRHFHPDELDFIEEPLVDPTQLEHFRAITEFEYGLDETTRSPGFDITHFPHAHAIVCKPTMIGGAADLMAISETDGGADVARRRPNIFLSSSYESAVGLAHIARLATELGIDTPLGIGTQGRFRSAVVEPRGREPSTELTTTPTLDIGALEHLGSIPDRGY